MHLLSRASVEGMLKPGFSLILNDDVEANWAVSKTPAKGASFLAANQAHGLGSTPGYFLLSASWTAGAGCACSPPVGPCAVALRRPGAQDDAVGSRQKGNRMGLSEVPLFFLPLDVAGRTSSNYTRLQVNCIPGLSPNQWDDFTQFFSIKKNNDLV